MNTCTKYLFSCILLVVDCLLTIVDLDPSAMLKAGFFAQGGILSWAGNLLTIAFSVECRGAEDGEKEIRIRGVQNI